MQEGGTYPPPPPPPPPLTIFALSFFDWFLFEPVGNLRDWWAHPKIFHISALLHMFSKKRAVFGQSPYQCAISVKDTDCFEHSRKHESASIGIKRSTSASPPPRMGYQVPKGTKVHDTAREKSFYNGINPRKNQLQWIQIHKRWIRTFVLPV